MATPTASTPDFSQGTSGPLDTQLLAASATGKLEEVERLLASKAHAYFQDENGVSPLMLASYCGHATVVSALLAAGAPWNALDKEHRCAGDYAIKGGHQKVVDGLLDAGVRSELILGAALRNDTDVGTQKQESNPSSAPRDDYLTMNVRYDETKLVDDENRGVMMQWEGPLMEAHAQVLCTKAGMVTDASSLHILNVGFGMGLIDTAIQSYKPRLHYIIEAHPQVHQTMLKRGWGEKPGVHILFGRWQDVLPPLLAEGKVQFDGVFFDTFGEHDQDMHRFHGYLPRLLRADGIYSFFNGMCPSNFFFHSVACEVFKLQLAQQNFSTEFVRCPIDCSDPAIWKDVKMLYWQWDTYFLPICRLLTAGNSTGTSAPMADDAAADAAALKKRRTEAGAEKQDHKEQDV